MEKLVKLLNEYHFSWTEYIWYYLDEKENRIYFRTKVIDKWLIDEQRISDERIISKKFWFIKLLVDNDKIDKKKFEDEFFVCWCCGYKLLSTREACDACWDKVLDVYKALLMRLAIQDEPIEFLISILK